MPPDEDVVTTEDGAGPDPLEEAGESTNQVAGDGSEQDSDNGLQQHSLQSVQEELRNAQSLVGRHTAELEEGRKLRAAIESDPELYQRYMQGGQTTLQLPGSPRYEDDEEPEPNGYQNGYQPAPNGQQVNPPPLDRGAELSNVLSQAIYNMEAPEKIAAATQELIQYGAQMGAQQALNEVQPWLSQSAQREQQTRDQQFQADWAKESASLKDDLGVDTNSPAENARLWQVANDLAARLNLQEGHYVPADVIAALAYKEQYAAKGRQRAAAAEQTRRSGADAASQTSVQPNGTRQAPSAPGSSYGDYVAAARRELSNAR